MSKARIGEVKRKSKETQLSARVSLDGGGRVNIATGLPFLDHMLEQVARYAGVDMKLKGVGDLHVENFGTWRDVEGRLVWGVNDFDEAYALPYTNDLVRLVASVA